MVSILVNSVAVLALALYSDTVFAGSPSDESLQENQITAQSAELKAVVAACSVGVPAGIDPRTNPNDLSFLMTRYFAACHSDLAVIDHLYHAEARDEKWAKQIEQQVMDASASVRGLTAKGECHASLCKYNFISAEGQDNLALVLQFNQNFFSRVLSIHRLGGTNVPSGVKVSEEYLYSEELPAPFVDEFVKLMEGSGH